MARGIAELAGCLLDVHEGLDLIPWHYIKLGVILNTCNHSTLEVEIADTFQV